MKYTREQLEAMPDRELDAVVATVVMGWSFNEDVVYDEDDCRCPPLTAVKDGNRFRRLPEFSTDIAAAWEVVEKMGFSVLYDLHTKRYQARRHVVMRDDAASPWQTSAPRAISIAAVLAVQEANK